MNRVETKMNITDMMCISINMKETGIHLKRLLKDRGYTVKTVMSITGLASEQAIYNWYSGKSLPSIENLLILSRTLQTPINELLVTDEGPFFMP